ncbi:MAG TPA: hypothetical protein PKI05_00645 [Thermogutta sp.]|nr:hypothetical protein [Thermogutta sp.]
MENPYKPPTAQLRWEPSHPGSLVKAVIAGVLIDLGGTWIVNFVGLAAYAFYLYSQGWSEDQVSREYVFLFIYSFPGLILPTARFGMSIVAGCICAKIAKRRRLLAAILVSLTSALFGYLVLKNAYSYYAWREHLWLTALCSPALCLGAYLYARGRHPRKRKVQATWTMTD